MDWAILKKPATTIAGLLGKHPICPSQAPGQEYGSYPDSLFAQSTRVVNMVAFPVRIKKQNLARYSVDYIYRLQRCERLKNLTDRTNFIV